MYLLISAVNVGFFVKAAILELDIRHSGMYESRRRLKAQIIKIREMKVL